MLITCVSMYLIGLGLSMYDKIDLEIPFSALHVSVLQSSKSDKPSGQLLNVAEYGFKMTQDSQMVNGVLVTQTMKARKWDSISSGISGIAIGFFPQGNGFNSWPHIRIKCSPAKLLQGHNVFGSEDPTQGIFQMLACLQMAYPNIYSHLDLSEADLKYTDVTYSSKIRAFFRARIYGLFASLATKNTKINKNDDYLQLGVGSEYARQKLYYKMQELLADLKDAQRSRDIHRVAILSDKRLQDWTLDLMRFEATLGPRKLLALGVPTRLNDFLKFNRWFLAVHKRPLSQYLWECVFNPLLAQIEGHTMKNVNDDDIKAQIDAKYITVNADTGKISKRKANEIFKTYRAIKSEGYKKLSQEDNSSFFRNVKLMEDVGISRAFLKSLDPQRPDVNVIPFIQIIKIDFNNQRPDWYVEPQADFSDTRRHLKLVG